MWATISAIAWTDGAALEASMGEVRLTQRAAAALARMYAARMVAGFVPCRRDHPDILAARIAVGIDVGWHRGPGSPPLAVGIDVGIDVGWHRGPGSPPIAVGIDVKQG